MVSALLADKTRVVGLLIDRSRVGELKAALATEGWTQDKDVEAVV